MNGKKKAPQPKPVEEPEKKIEDYPPQQEPGEKVFTQEELERAWNDYADKIKDRPRLHHMLKSRTPQLKENAKLVLKLDNPLQQDTLGTIIHELHHFLRNQLDNKGIEIEPFIESEKEEENESNKLYTLNDKFNYLAEKNKALQKLKKDFDLDFDY